MSEMHREGRSAARLPMPRLDEERIESLLDFWFESSPTDERQLARLFRRWFQSSEEDDRELEARFGELSEAAAAGNLDFWRTTARGSLALILLLDQLPRNRHRGTAAAFAQDAKALALCTQGIARGIDRELAPLERGFFYMPLQHDESREIQAQSVDVFGALAAAPAPESIRSVLEGFARYAELHRDIIERFGRFPHRNRILERASTREEREYLADGGPSFGQ
jgi:uncharacterized protein (DUF924 family)